MTLSQRTFIVSGAPFFRDGARVWLPPIEWKSLRQWWEFMDNVVLLKPQHIAESPPDGWLELPPNIITHRLCSSDAGRLTRRRETLRAARKYLERDGVLMLRMPYYESAWCFQVGEEVGIPHFVELHGDWETAVLEEDSQTLFRKATRRYRAKIAVRQVRKMSASAAFALGVGPKLIEKFVPPNVPSLVSTNHLLDFKDYEARSDVLENGPARLLFVGAIQRRKGLHVLFEALSKLSDSSLNFRLDLVGDGPIIEDLRRLASSLGIERCVNFAGELAHGETLFEYFRSSDLFILPSIAAEGVPRVIHEAMAFGCPVIATDIGSVAWQLAGDAGIVVPAGDADRLAYEIRRVISSKELQRDLSVNGFKRSLEFTYEKQKARIRYFTLEHLRS